MDDNNEILTLSGKRLTRDGKISKHHFFDCLKLDLDKYDDITFTPEEAKSVQLHLLHLQTGATAMVPLICGGRECCPLAATCPLVKIDKAPVGRQCSLEKSLINTWIIQYINEYEVDPNNFTEIGYVSELAEIDILLMRINTHLARPENGLGIIDQAVGVDKDGEPIFRQELSPLVEQKDKLQRRRSQIIKLMVGDRQEKYKKQAALKQKPDGDLSTEQAAIKKKLSDLTRAVDTMSGNISDRTGPNEHGVVSPQEIIDAEEE